MHSYLWYEQKSKNSCAGETKSNNKEYSVDIFIVDDCKGSECCQDEPKAGSINSCDDELGFVQPLDFNPLSENGKDECC